MTALPQLIEEDIHHLDSVLRDLLTKTEATTALIIDKGGFLITSRGDGDKFDLTTIAALASGAYMANETIAQLVHEPTFSSVYQQGATHSMFIVSVDECCLLVIIFKASVSVGIVKYFAVPAVKKVTQQLKIAHERSPEDSLDLSRMNLADPQLLFRKKD